MNRISRFAAAAFGAVLATQAAAQITFYENDDFQGRTFSTSAPVDSFANHGFNDRASSIIVTTDRWEVCQDAGFNGRCVVLRPGRYPSLASMGLNDRVSSVRTVGRNARVDDQRYAPLPDARADYRQDAVPAAPQVIFYEEEGFQGRAFSTAETIENFRNTAFNNRASSIVVSGERFEVCQNSGFRGRCVVLRPGRYPSLVAMGLNDQISSVRVISRNARIDDQRYAPLPDVQATDYRRRGNERLYEANVTSVHAVLGPPEQRCWVEHEQVSQERSPNVGGALAGAVLGGIIGHQIGGGTGRDVATIGGVVGGAAVGSRVGNRQAPATQDVQRCESVPSQAKPSFWDVTYTFRGQEHRVQMTAPPGPTVTVNREGEPRA